MGKRLGAASGMSISCNPCIHRLFSDPDTSRVIADQIFRQLILCCTTCSCLGSGSEPCRDTVTWRLNAATLIVLDECYHVADSYCVVVLVGVKGIGARPSVFGQEMPDGLPGFSLPVAALGVNKSKGRYYEARTP